MLHLLTSQVSFSIASSRNPERCMHRCTQPLREEHFILGNDEPQWQQYLKASFLVLKDEGRDIETTASLVSKLQGHLPHWTSACNDKIVYTTVVEAHSSSTDDVGTYLAKLKNCV